MCLLFVPCICCHSFLFLRSGIFQTLNLSDAFADYSSTWDLCSQIFATTGDKKAGGTHVLYDPAISEKGALVCVARAPRKKSVEDLEAKPVVHNPHALPLFRDAPSRKRAREKARSDPVKSKRPDLPMSGPGFGGRVGTTKGSLLTQYLMRVSRLSPITSMVFLYRY